MELSNYNFEKFLFFRKRKPRKNFLYFLKRKFFLYFGKRKPRKNFYISGNGNPKKTSCVSRSNFPGSKNEKKNTHSLRVSYISGNGTF